MSAEEIVSRIKQATDFETNKRILWEKIQTDLHLAYEGGLFKLSPELLVYLGMQNALELVVLDVYNNPVKITKPEEFYLRCRDQYQKVLNQYFVMYEELRRIRKA